MGSATVEVPRWALAMALDGGPWCNVCTGYSPSWDGHNVNPPCEGYAKQVLREAIDK